MSAKWLATTALAVGVVALPGVAAAETQLHLFGGIASAQDLEASYYGYDVEMALETGFVIGGALGVSRNDFVFEGELAYRSAGVDEVTVGGYSYSGVDADVSATSLMGNVWYNFPSTGNMGVYAGGGIGVARIQAEVEGYTYSDDSTEFAWQLGGGVNLKTESGFTYGLGYRFFNGSVDEIDLTSHDIVFEIGMRY